MKLPMESQKKLTKGVLKKNEYYCPIEVTLDVLSGKWKGAILWWLGQQPHRFGELRDLIPGLSRQMLTTRLRELEKQGLVSRVVFKEKPPRVEYALTELGEELSALTNSLCKFGKKIEPNGHFIFEEVLKSLR